MGAGVAAVAIIDNEPSPRRAAIERAQAELRREVAVRDERRRELEFLERGGNPLDFRFGDTSAGSFWLLPPTARDEDPQSMRHPPAFGTRKEAGENAPLTVEGAKGSSAAETGIPSIRGGEAAAAGKKPLDKASEEDEELVRGFQETKRLKVCNGGDAENRSTTIHSTKVDNRSSSDNSLAGSDDHQSNIAMPGIVTSQHSKNHGGDMQVSVFKGTCSSIPSSIIESDTLDEKLSVKDGCRNDAVLDTVRGVGVFKVKVEDGTLDGPVSPSASPILSRQSDPLLPEGADVMRPAQPRVANVVSAQSDSACLHSNEVGTMTNTLPSTVAVSEEKLQKGAGDVGVKASYSALAKKLNQSPIVREKEGPKNAELTKRKVFPEPPRQKFHWDFVLEEMAWLANDFMQERLWKVAAAAQVARWVAKERKQQEFQEAELCNRQKRIARMLASAVTKYWQSVETLLNKAETNGNDSVQDSRNNTTGCGLEPMALDMGDKEGRSKTMAGKESVQNYVMRFVKDLNSFAIQAEAPTTPDRMCEAGVFDFWEEQFSEESLFYTVPNGGLEVYRQAIVSQWELVQNEYEQRLQDHEDVQGTADAMEDSGGLSEFGPSPFGNATGPQASAQVTGKRSSGLFGAGNFNVGGIPTKRVRTSALAARQRAAGMGGHGAGLMSGSVGQLARSDISSGETNSQQDEVANLLEGSSASGRATDAESNGAFARYMHADGVDSPPKSKKRKKTRHFNAGPSETRELEPIWNVRRQTEQQTKQKGEHISQTGTGNSASEGLGGSHGATTNTGSVSKLGKQIGNRDRGRKYKAGKASSNQPGIGVPWSPVEDQAILGLVYELGSNWELVSDILRSSSQLKGIYRKAKDCKERYKVLTDRAGGDGGDSPEDSSASVHLPIMNPKGGARFLPQHLEETLKAHLECILHLHRVLRSKKAQTEAQEPKPSVSTHESHTIKQSDPHHVPTPLELCEQSSTSGELTSNSYSIYPSHGNALGMLSSGLGMRPVSSGMALMHGTKSLQSSPGGLSPAAAISAAASRDAQRMSASMRTFTAEERLRYNRMVAGRTMEGQALANTSSLPLMGLPTASDFGVPVLPSGRNAGVMCGLSRGMPLSRAGLPGVGSSGAPSISSGMSNTMPSVAVGLPGTNALSPSGLPPSMNAMRRPRDAVPMAVQAHSQAASLGGLNNLPSTIVSSPTHAAQQQQQQIQQHLSQHNLGQSQQHMYNMMRVKERQQLQQQQQQQQQQKRMLQQHQQSPASNNASFASIPMSQQQHLLSSHAQMLSQQHQPSPLLSQQHVLPILDPQQPQAGPTQQAVMMSIASSNTQQSIDSPSARSPLSTGATVSPKHHHNHSGKQHQHQPQAQQHQQQPGKNSKGLGRPVVQVSSQQASSILPGQVSPQFSGKPLPRLFHGQVQSGQQATNVPQGGLSNQTQALAVNLSQMPNMAAQHKAYSQTLHGKQMAQPQSTPTPLGSAAPSIQPTSPPHGASVGQQLPSPVGLSSMPSAQRCPNQPSQAQQRRPQQRQSGTNTGLHLPQPGKNGGLQPAAAAVGSPIASGQPTNMPSFPLSNNLSNLVSPPPSMSLPSSDPPSQWKPGQNFSPMAAGLYNLSRSNGGAVASMATTALNASAPSLSSSSSTSPQQPPASQGGGVKPSATPTVITRAVPASSPRQQQHYAGGSSSHANLAFQGSTVTVPPPVSGSMFMYNGVQHRQAHQTTASTVASVSSISPAGSVPSSAMSSSSTIPKSSN